MIKLDLQTNDFAFFRPTAVEYFIASFLRLCSERSIFLNGELRINEHNRKGTRGLVAIIQIPWRSTPDQFVVSRANNQLGST